MLVICILTDLWLYNQNLYFQVKFSNEIESWILKIRQIVQCVPFTLTFKNSWTFFFFWMKIVTLIPILYTVFFSFIIFKNSQLHQKQNSLPINIFNCKVTFNNMLKIIGTYSFYFIKELKVFWLFRCVPYMLCFLTHNMNNGVSL